MVYDFVLINLLVYYSAPSMKMRVYSMVNSYFFVSACNSEVGMRHFGEEHTK